MGVAMFRQFRNSNIGYYLYSALVLLIGAASIFAFWFMITGFNLGVYSENTFIGSVYIGGLDEREAEQKLRDRINAWYDDEEIIFEAVYHGYTYEFDRNEITFDVEESMDNIRDGRASELIVFFPEDLRPAILDEIRRTPFMNEIEARVADPFDLELLLDDMLASAANMDLFARRRFEDYVYPETESVFFGVVNTSTRTPDASLHPTVDVLALHDKLLEHFEDGSFHINPRSRLSMLETMPESLSRQELSYVSSLLMDLIFATPFDFKYTQSPIHPDDEFYYGRNVQVRRLADQDFAFENCMDAQFTVTFSVANDALLFSLEGAPFLDDITVTSPPEIILLPYGTITVTNPEFVRDGVNGRIVVRTRIINDLSGALVSEQEIINERYEPVAERVLSGN